LIRFNGRKPVRADPVRQQYLDDFWVGVVARNGIVGYVVAVRQHRDRIGAGLQQQLHHLWCMAARAQRVMRHRHALAPDELHARAGFDQLLETAQVAVLRRIGKLRDLRVGKYLVGRDHGGSGGGVQKAEQDCQWQQVAPEPAQHLVERFHGCLRS
jgi:hypothetical protein